MGKKKTIKWFKHYGSLGEKDFSQELIEKHGLQAYARYHLLLETCTLMHGDKIDGSYSVSVRVLCRRLVCKRQHLAKILSELGQLMGFSASVGPHVVNICIPILAELLSSDTDSWKKRRALDKDEDKEKDKDEDKDSTKPAKKAAPDKKTELFIATYCALFKSKYHSNPHIQGRDAGIAKRVSKDLTEEKIKLLLEAFFQMPDAWLVKRKHPVSDFEAKLNEIVVFSTTGKFHTNRQVQQADDFASNAMLLKEIREGRA